jgi:predicted aspartyl protease
MNTEVMPMAFIRRTVLCCALLGSQPSLSLPENFSAADTQSTEIPFKLYNENLIVVKGSVGPIGDVNILLDTGTSPTAVSTDLATRLNLHGATEPLVSANGEIEVDSAILPRMDVGMLHITSARVVVQDLSFMQRRLGISIGAVAGVDLISTGSFMIDYRKRTIVFSPTEAPKKWVPFETQKPYLTVKAHLGGRELRLLVDSATPGLLVFASRLGNQPADLEQLATGQDAPMFTATGTMRAKWFHASQVRLGMQSIGSQMILVADGDAGPEYEFDGLLGLAKTGFQKIWFDFENGLFGWT